MRIITMIEITMCLFWSPFKLPLFPIRQKNVTTIELSSFFEPFDSYDESLQLFILSD